MVTKTKINININDTVLVKLTEYGKTKLFEEHYRFWTNTGADMIPRFVLPKEDSYGYSEWQLWVLMQRLGSYCDLGNEPLFDTDIIIVK